MDPSLFDTIWFWGEKKKICWLREEKRKLETLKRKAFWTRKSEIFCNSLFFDFKSCHALMYTVL